MNDSRNPSAAGAPGAEWPRTLIVGPLFSSEYGTGTFLSHLFAGCPKENLAVVSPMLERPNWARFDRLYRPGCDELLYPRGLSWANSRAISGPVQPERPGVSTLPKPPLPLRAGRFLLHRSLVRLFGTYEVMVTSTVSEKLVHWVREFKPDVIYGTYGNILSASLLSSMSDVLDIPLVIHVMDDWGENMYLKGPLSGFARKVWRQTERNMISKAAIAIAICGEMGAAYQKRYQRDWTSLPMPVDSKAFVPHARTSWEARSPFRIRYGGRVGWAIHKSIVAVAQAVDRLRKQGFDIVFEIRVGDTQLLAPELKDLQGVSLGPLEPYETLAASQTAADALLICYDFSPVAFRNARYSMPSKTTECMASGTPCLVYGPPGLPVVEYARRSQWALLVDDPSPQALDAAIIRLVKDNALRAQLGRTALDLVQSTHDAAKVSEFFCRLLRRAAFDASSK